MTKKVFENEEEIKMTTEYMPRVKQMTRKFGPNPDSVIATIEAVDAELSSWINAGWKLSFVERAATEPDGYTVLYILTKD